MTQETHTGALQQPRGMGGRREVREGRDISTPMFDSC